MKETKQKHMRYSGLCEGNKKVQQCEYANECNGGVCTMQIASSTMCKSVKWVKNKLFVNKIQRSSEG